MPAQSKFTALYVPTGFSENKRYGPFRDIDDKDYVNWQKVICDYSENIFYKNYPNQDLKFDLDKNRILYTDLKQLIKKDLGSFDFFIIDYFSTVSTLLAATEKPIYILTLGCIIFTMR